MENKRYKRKFQILIGNDHKTIVCAENKSNAIDQGIVKMFGAGCFWFPNHGCPGFGQVFKSLTISGNSAVTHTTEITITTIGKPSHNFIKQQKQDIENNKTSQHDKYQETKTDWYYAGRTGMPCPQDNEFWFDWNEGKNDLEEDMRIDKEKYGEY